MLEPFLVPPPAPTPPISPVVVAAHCVSSTPPRCFFQFNVSWPSTGREELALACLGPTSPILFTVPRSLAVLQQLFISEILVDFILPPLTDLHFFKYLFKTIYNKGAVFKSGKKDAMFPVWKGLIYPLLIHLNSHLALYPMCKGGWAASVNKGRPYPKALAYIPYILCHCRHGLCHGLTHDRQVFPRKCVGQPSFLALWERWSCLRRGRGRREQESSHVWMQSKPCCWGSMPANCSWWVWFSSADVT